MSEDYTEEIQTKLGEQLAKYLKLEKNPNGFYNTVTGEISPSGLWYMISRFAYYPSKMGKMKL